MPRNYRRDRLGRFASTGGSGRRSGRRSVSARRGPLISRKTAAGAAGALGVAGVVFGANAIVVRKGITAAHTRAVFKL